MGRAQEHRLLPREVLELMRWAEGEHVDHVARALSCTLLCLASPENDLSNTGPPLVQSALALGTDQACRARELFTWLEANDPDGPEGSIAACLLCIMRAASDPNDLQIARHLQRMLQSDTRGLRECIATSPRVALWASLIEAALAPLHADVESRG